MEFSRFVECLGDDFALLRAAVAVDVAPTVPTCPEWTVADLGRHVGQVYLHKTSIMRDGAEPDPWPPEGLDEEEPLALLDRTYADLVEQFAAHTPEDRAQTWYGPDQTVGFWIRRMAQETVVHRIDAELAVGKDVSPVPDDLAVDGVDELLRIFVGYYVREWPDHFGSVLAGSPGWTCALRTTDGSAAWTVRTGAGWFDVEDGVAETVDATVIAEPQDLLRWVWNRETPGEQTRVVVEGEQAAVEEMRACVAKSTQ
ncbi:maleylpyruvate isomerase family mycothiol-dependent enzyme [Yinghuangia seranimata]|uniref:maleylpyruvate isomerase family mycothiol-dependent enzyme n=1 Tax=Yinghuangia seranimata TaxID=408067 RepID=UPI00248C1C37|nr:maleylpyruvate isomerase family mycothiol-dependent enzyme [Yinghuangia seranimata]MDI2129796.1 maleylpyruvate isomerase family mycothiol-dependent enzyme [Yinghuangia seranimata]